MAYTDALRTGGRVEKLHIAMCNKGVQLIHDLCIVIEVLNIVLGYHLVMYIAVSVVRLCHLGVSFSIRQKSYMNIYEVLSHLS